MALLNHPASYPVAQQEVIRRAEWMACCPNSRSLPEKTYFW